MDSEIILGIMIVLFFMIAIAGIIAAYFVLNNRINKSRDEITTYEETGQKRIANIDSTNASQDAKLSTIANTVGSQMGLVTTLNANLTTMGVAQASLSNSLASQSTQLNSYNTQLNNMYASQSNMLSAQSNMSTSFNTNSLGVGGKMFAAIDPVTNNLMLGTRSNNPYMGIAMVNNPVTFSNMSSYNALLTTMQASNVAVYGSMAMSQSGNLQFAGVDTKYTLDTSGVESNLRLMIALGNSNVSGELGIYTLSASNDTLPRKVHSFDSQGNATHAGSLNINANKCIELGMGNGSLKAPNTGKLCYLSTNPGGMDIYGGSTNSLSREVNVWDNINVNNTIKGSNVQVTEYIGLNGMQITASNGALYVTNSLGAKSMISMSNL